MPIVRIPILLRKLTNDAEEVTVLGRTLGGVLEELNINFPGFGDRILDNQGGVRRFVNIFVNDEDMRFLQGKETLLEEGDIISIIPAIAGG